MVSDSWEMTHNLPKCVPICQDWLETTMEVQISAILTIRMQTEAGV